MIIGRYAKGSEIFYGEQISPLQWRRLQGAPFEHLVRTEHIDANDQVRLLCPL